MGQRLVEHRLTSKCQRVRIVKGISHSFMRVLKPYGVVLTAIADDDPARMATWDVYLLQAGDEIPAGLGFMGVVEGAFVFGREVADPAAFTVLKGGGLP